MKVSHPADGADAIRRIETLADVGSVLESKASPSELMDCVAVARAAGAWQLRHRCALRAFQLCAGKREPVIIADVAAEVVRSQLRLAPTLDELGSRVGEAIRFLDDWKPASIRSDQVRERERERLNELLMFLTDDRPMSLVKLAKVLRQVDRSDFAVVAAERALAREGAGNVVCSTVLAAALADVNDLSRARELVDTTVKRAPRSAPILTVASRVYQLMDLLPEALDLGRQAFAVERSRKSAFRLLAIAARVHDKDAFADAELAIAEIRETEPNEDRWLSLLATEVLIEAGRLEDARNSLQRLRPGSWGVEATTVSRLGRKLAAAERRASQPSLFEESGGSKPGPSTSS